MPLLAWVVRLLAGIGPWVKYIGQAMSWLWKWLGVVARNPVSWVVLSLLPILDLFLEMTIGVSVGVGPVMRWVVTSLSNVLLAYAVDTGYLQGAWDALPATVLEISCYIGATEAIQFLFSGIVSALVSLLVMKIMLWRLKFSSWGRVYRKWP